MVDETEADLEPRLVMVRMYEAEVEVLMEFERVVRADTDGDKLEISDPLAASEALFKAVIRGEVESVGFGESEPQEDEVPRREAETDWLDVVIGDLALVRLAQAEGDLLMDAIGLNEDDLHCVESED